MRDSERWRCMKYGVHMWNKYESCKVPRTLDEAAVFGAVCFRKVD
jgi:hypothetical protein